MQRFVGRVLDPCVLAPPHPPSPLRGYGGQALAPSHPPSPLRGYGRQALAPSPPPHLSRWIWIRLVRTSVRIDRSPDMSAALEDEQHPGSRRLWRFPGPDAHRAIGVSNERARSRTLGDLESFPRPGHLARRSAKTAQSREPDRPEMLSQGPRVCLRAFCIRHAGCATRRGLPDIKGIDNVIFVP